MYDVRTGACMYSRRQQKKYGTAESINSALVYNYQRKKCMMSNDYQDADRVLVSFRKVIIRCLALLSLVIVH